MSETPLDFESAFAMVIKLFKNSDKIFASLTYDIGNIVKIMTLEQTG